MSPVDWAGSVTETSPHSKFLLKQMLNEKVGQPVYERKRL